MSELRTAMVLAAGFGSRMGELTKSCPKPLLPVGDLTIIDIIFHKLRNQGIRRIVVNTHYMANKFAAHFESFDLPGVELCISHEPEILGSGGGIANAEPYFEGGDIISMNADVICDIDIRDFYKAHRISGALASMTVMPSRNNVDYTLATYNERNELTGFLKREEPVPDGMRSGIFTGHQLLSAEARNYLQPQFQSIIKELYLRALQTGRLVNIYPFEGRWIDIGTREMYASFLAGVDGGEIDLSTFV